MKNILLIAAIFLLFAACSTNDHGHDHSVMPDDSSVETESISLYSENLEVFTEFELLKTGHESEFLIHITRLDSSYSAYTGGPVKLSIKVAGHRQNILAEPAHVEGIYELHLVPEKAGIGSITFEIPLNSGSTEVLTQSIHVYSEDEEIHHAETEASGLISFTKEQAWKTNFNVTQVKLQEFSEVVKTSGEFLPLPGEKQNVIAKSQGVVLFSTRNLVQGKYVNKGEELFTLSGQGLADNNILVQFNEAKTNYLLSKSKYVRHQSLFKENIISQKQYLQSESDFINDSIRYYSLVETVGDEGMKIIAPQSGYLHELNVSEGQFVEPGTLMATISSNQVMLLRADVPQQYFNVLDKITTTNFRPAYTQKVYTLDELAGKLIARGASVAENNHFMPVYFEVVNDGTLLEGAFAEFFLKTKTEPGHLVIPATSLVEEQGNYYVYVQRSGEEYEKRAVKILASDGLNVSIKTGLQPGERVVSEGAMLIKTASTSGIPAHSHQH